MGPEILIPLAGIAMIVAIVIGPLWLKNKERREMQETVRHALDKGQPLPPELVDAISRSAATKVSSRSRDIRVGIVWLAVGIGIALFSLVSDMGWSGGWDNDFDSGLLGIATIPATIGVAFIILSFFNKNRD